MLNAIILFVVIYTVSCLPVALLCKIFPRSKDLRMILCGMVPFLRLDKKDRPRRGG